MGKGGRCERSVVYKSLEVFKGSLLAIGRGYYAVFSRTSSPVWLVAVSKVVLLLNIKRNQSALVCVVLGLYRVHGTAFYLVEVIDIEHSCFSS